MRDYDGVVGILGAKDFLVDKLKDKLTSKYMDVKLFEKTDKYKSDTLNYLVINLLNNHLNKNDVINIARNFDYKVLLLHPLYVNKNQKFVAEEFIRDFLSSNSNASVLLVPELVGEGADYNKTYFSHELIMQSIISNRVKVNTNLNFVNLVTYSKLADTVIKELFSFGSLGQTTVVMGPRISSTDFCKQALDIDHQNILLVKNVVQVDELHYNNTLKVEFSINAAVKKTVEKLKQEIQESPESLLPEVIDNSPKVSKPKEDNKTARRFKKNMINNLKRLALVSTVFILIPFILLGLSFGTFYMSYSNANKSLDYSLDMINHTISLTDLNNDYISVLGFYEVNSIVAKTARLFRESLYLARVSSNLFVFMTGDDLYDVETISSDISASVDKLHTDFNFFQTDINESKSYFGKTVREYLSKSNVNLKKVKQDLFELKNITSRLSNALGNDSPKKYLVLFQNNMELRPTGGFIGSFALITFDKGRMTEIVVNDVYSADGQLKGYVEPPAPIRDYLGEAAWYMRDSNWDPDFSISSERVEWFLDKEINQTVDGVIAIDLYFVRKLLEVTGPIKLNDFNQIVDSNNIYTVTQSEVEDDFFPGSIKKASFLTALSKNLITETESLPKNKHFQLVKAIYESLLSKHIQISMHDQYLQESLQKIGFSGSLDLSIGCGIRCLRNPYMLNDANVGVNKANLYIERSHDLNVSVSKEKITNELRVVYQNNASSALGQSAYYKTYTRLFVPLVSEVQSLRIHETSGSYIDVDFDLIETPNRKEVGFYMEVLPESVKTIQIIWDINSDLMKDGGELRLNVIKQAGTEADNITIRSLPKDLSLTGPTKSVYNTNLARDLFLPLYFK